MSDCSPTPRNGACRPAPARVNGTLAQLVAGYVRENRPDLEASWRWYSSALSLSDAIRRAAGCVREDGKWESHQYGVPKAALLDLQGGLSLQPLGRARDFDDLHAFVRRTAKGIPGIGDLTVYDVAVRIGAYQRLRPERVYLHAGTLVGAKALGMNTTEASLPVATFPREMHLLRSWEIEDFLCIYKQQLAKLHKVRG